MITITDGQRDVILDDITEDFFWNDKHYKSLKDTLETFDFTTFADKTFSEHLAKNNRIIIPGEDGELVEFIIHNTRKYRSSNGGLFMEVYTSASYIELKHSKVIRPQTTGAWTPQQHTGFALSGTGWEPGRIDFAGIRTITIERHTNPFAYLKKIASEFGLELRFRVKHDGNQITGRYVDLIERVGAWQGREVEFGKDLLGIERKEDTSNVVTALVGLGPEREDGTRLEVFVEDKEALARWGRNGQHIIDLYEPQSVDAEMTESRLRELTQNELEKRVNSVVEYVSDIADLEKVPGLEHEKIRFGDTIKIKDTGFNPPLYLEARVHTQERSIKKNGRKTVALGDYIEHTEEEVQAIWKALQSQIAKKISMADVLEVTYTKEEIDEKDIPGKEAKEKIDRDVGEAFIETTDGSQDKADQAERNAKNHADSVANQARQEAITEAVSQAQQALNNAVNELETSIAEKADAQWVSGQLQLKADSETVSVIQNTVGELQDTASSLQLAVSDHADELEAQGGRITTVETDLNTVEGQLSATITDLSALEGAVSQQQTQIEANASAIALKANQEDLNDLTGEVSSISGQLTVMAGQIEAKAEKSELQTLEDNVTQVSNDLASLTVEVGGISSNVSSLSQTVSSHGTEISDINSSITQLAGQIESKVDKTEYETDKDGIINRLDSAETRISQTEQDIQARVTKTEYQQDKQELEGGISQLETRMSTAETNIQANTTAISLKANSEDVYTKTQVDQELGKKVDTTVYNQKIGELTTSINGISANVSNLQTTVGQHGTSISNLQSQVDIQAGQIASKVDATYVQGAIADIQIGGRNLLKNSGFEDDLRHWTSRGSNSISLTDGYNGKGLLVNIATNGTEIVTPRQIINVRLSKDEILTCQVKVKAENFEEFETRSMRVANQATLDLVPALTKVLDDGWRLYVYQYKATNNIVLNQDFGFAYGTGLSFIVDELKLEKGNRATDWTPAPEDVQSEIDNVYEYASSEIQQLAGQVSTKAEASTVTAIGNRVTTAEQTIDALSGQIASKVDATYVQDAIADIEVGGRNLLRNSDFKFGFDVYWDRINSSPLSNFTITSEGLLKVTKSSDNAEFGKENFISLNNLEDVENLTASAWVKGNGEFTIRFGYSSNRVETVNSDTIKKYVFHIPKSRFGNGNFIISVTSGEIFFARVKAEIGNKSTDWTPAPEDTQAEIDDVYQYASSEIQQLAGEVSTKAEVSTVTALGNRVTTAEHNISALEGEISQKVSKTDYNGNTIASMINQTATTIKLQASKINLDGQVEAKHIKSLNGLNVGNGQFVVDANGNIKYAGNLEGATGTFSGDLVADRVAIESPDFGMYGGIELLLQTGFLSADGETYNYDGHISLNSWENRLVIGKSGEPGTSTVIDSIDLKTLSLLVQGNKVLDERDTGHGNGLDADTLDGYHATELLIARGSNSNGDYIRFANGIQICWFSKEITTSINTAYGSLFIGSYQWSYPATFISAPTVSCSDFKWGTGSSWGAVNAADANQALLRGLDVLSRPSGSARVSAIAIGRWE